MKKNFGFSLVELMIVVAIVGILSAIAIPNFIRFQRKARQTEAKSNLGAVILAERATFAEIGFYVGNFSVNGFKPEGSPLTYRIIEAENPSVAGLNLVYRDATCTTTDVTKCTTYNPTPGVTGWKELPAGAATPSPIIGPNTSGIAPPSANATYVQAYAYGFIGGAQDDQWSADSSGTVSNMRSGL